MHHFSDHFPDKPGSADCPKIKGFGARFYGLNVLPAASQQIYTLGFTVFASTSTRVGEGFCISSPMPMLLKRICHLELAKVAAIVGNYVWPGQHE